MQWEKMVREHPEILEGSTNKYQNWETTDPEQWVPHGYAVVRVDSRGAGDPADRPRDVFGSNVTLYAGGPRKSYLLLPLIPPKQG